MRRAALATVLVGLAALSLAQEAPRRPVQLYAHRGFTRELPENSLSALTAAAALGVAGAEIDLRTTKDGHVVLMHDPTVDRTTTGSGPIESMTLAAVQALRLEAADGRAATEGVPDLDAVLRFLDAHPRFAVAFDAKSIDVAAVGRRVSAAGLHRRITFFIDDPLDVERARAIKQVDPRLRLSVNLMAWWKTEGLATFVTKALDADALFSHEFYFPRFGGDFGEAKRAGAEVQVYLPGADRLPERLERVVRMGADVVSSDRPDLIVDVAKRLAAR